MNREFDIGDKVICTASGVIGKVTKFYYPTSCAEQTMVRTLDGRYYHAPTTTWRGSDFERRDTMVKFEIEIEDCNHCPCLRNTEDGDFTCFYNSNIRIDSWDLDCIHGRCPLNQIFKN